MTDNRNSEAAWAYHEATKHSYLSIRANPHFLDWANQPLPFKIYPTLERLRLPGEVRPSGIAALSAIARAFPPRQWRYPTWGPWLNCSISPPASLGSESIRVARFTF